MLAGILTIVPVLTSLLIIVAIPAVAMGARIRTHDGTCPVVRVQSGSCPALKSLDEG